MKNILLLSLLVSTVVTVQAGCCAKKRHAQVCACLAHTQVNCDECNDEDEHDCCDHDHDDASCDDSDCDECQD